MSSSGYEGSHMSSGPLRHDNRRASGPMTPSYDRQPIPPFRRRTPSPTAQRRSFDSYAPHRPEPSFRDGSPNVYRPNSNSYRPDYAGGYNRASSPEPYAAPTNMSEDTWERMDSWRPPPPPIEIPNMWPERKPLPTSPTTSTRGRDVRDDGSTRAFEPSDSWKQTHVDRRPIPSDDRFLGRRGRRSGGMSPERPVRNERGPGSAIGDRYRAVPMKSNSHPTGRSDSYRPHYENGRPPMRRDSNAISPTGRPPRRDSGTFSHHRRPSRPDSPYMNRSFSRKGSPSPHSVISSINTPSRPPPETDVWASLRPEVPTRAPSRSSIASTHVSDRKSPTPPPPAVRIANAIEKARAALPKKPDPAVIAASLLPKPVGIIAQPEAPRPEVIKPTNGNMADNVSANDATEPKGPPGLIATEMKATPKIPLPSRLHSLDTGLSAKSPPQTNGKNATGTEEPNKNKERDLAKDVPPAAPPNPDNILGRRSPPLPPNAGRAMRRTSPPPPPPVSPNAGQALRRRSPPPLPTLSPNALRRRSPPPLSSLPPNPGQTLLRRSPAPLPPLPPPQAPQIPSIPTPIATPEPSEQGKAPESAMATPPVVEIHHPKPTYRPPTPKDDRMESDIPPTIHSPMNDESPPDSPAVVTPPIMYPVPYPSIEEIPPFSEARTKEEALRIVVMTRMLCDRQTRRERVDPVLMANQSISTPLEVHPTATPDSLLERMFSRNEQEMKDRMASFIKTRPMLARYLEKRHESIKEKQKRLRAEYLSRQEKWHAHCQALNEQQKTLASQEMQHAGRTTRRSTAVTDAVRSDFEMEQIIASLGVDDATDPNHLSMRNLARIPDMISVTHGKVDYLFDDTSHLVENPKEYYAPHTGIEDWKEDEKAIFLDKYAAFPKQFGIIADYLPNKTAAQCVDFYYLHKNKFIDFRKVVSQLAPNKRKRRGMGKKKGNGLLVDIAIHDMEVNRGGANATSASAPVTRAPRGRKSAASLEAKKALARRGAGLGDTPTATPTPEPESATPARGRRRKTAAPVSTSLATSTLPPSATPSRAPSPVMPPPPPAAPRPSVASPALSSLPPSVTPSVTPSITPSLTPSLHHLPPPAVTFNLPSMVVESPMPSPRPDIPGIPMDVDVRPIIKRAKRVRRIKSAAVVSDDASSPREGNKALPDGKNIKGLMMGTQWSEDDKRVFISLLSQYGKNFKRIAASMPNKTTIQVSNYFTNNAADLDLESIAARAPMRSPSPEYQDGWNELPYGTTVHMHPPSARRDETPPMASLSYDQYGDPSRRVSSEGVTLYTSQRYPASGQVPLPMARLQSGTQPYKNPLPTRNPYPFPLMGERAPFKYADGSARGYGETTQPYYAAMYPSPSAAAAAAGAVTAPIVHSPSGLGGASALPMHALHPFPTESPHHTSYYPPPPPPVRRDPVPVPTGAPQWTAYPTYYRETSSTSRSRRENPYPVFSPTHSREGSGPGTTTATTASAGGSASASTAAKGPSSYGSGRTWS